MRPINVHEYEQLAQAQLHTAVWEYYSGGAYDEVTLHENRAAFERLQIRPRMLVDVSRVTRSTTVASAHQVSMPIGVAPTAVQGAACLEGECATAQGAGAVGALMIASTQSTRSLEEIAEAATGPLWFQLYFSSRTHGQATQLVRRAEAAGYRAIVVTVDSARWGRKERYLHSQETYEWPPYGNFAPELMTPIEDGNDDAEEDDNDAALTWQDLEWLQSTTSLPIVTKGILTAEDASLAVNHRNCGSTSVQPWRAAIGHGAGDDRGATRGSGGSGWPLRGLHGWWRAAWNRRPEGPGARSSRRICRPPGTMGTGRGRRRRCPACAGTAAR